MDRGIAGLLANLWAACDTRSCCENEDGRAYVVPTADTCDAAAQLLANLGLHPTVEGGVIYFRMSDSFRLDDVVQVRRRLQRPTGIQANWRVNDSGVFEQTGPADDSDALDTGI